MKVFSVLYESQLWGICMVITGRVSRAREVGRGGSNHGRTGEKLILYLYSLDKQCFVINIAVDLGDSPLLKIMTIFWTVLTLLDCIDIT